MGGVLDYSTTAGSNTTVGGVNIAEGMQAGLMNNALRAALADSRKWQLDWSGIVTAGTSNAYTITSNQGITAYADGQRFSFRADRNNTGAATLNVDSRGAKALRKVTGGALAALAADEIVDGAVYDVVFIAADDVFVIVGFAAPDIATIQSDITALQTGKQDADDDLTAIAAFSGTGIAVRTAADTWAQRQIVSADGSVTITNPAGVAGDINLEAATRFTWLSPISTTSGSTPADFAIPSTASEICLLFKGTDRGTAGDDFLVRLGTASAFESSGYSHFSGIPASTGTALATAFAVQVGAAGAARGEMNLKHLGSNEWSQTHTVAHTTTRIAVGSGTKTLADVITRIRVLPSSGNWAGGAVQVGYR